MRGSKTGHYPVHVVTGFALPELGFYLISLVFLFLLFLFLITALLLLLGFASQGPSGMPDTPFFEVGPVSPGHVDVISLDKFGIIPEQFLVGLHLLL